MATIGIKILKIKSQNIERVFLRSTEVDVYVISLMIVSEDTDDVVRMNK